VTSFSLAAFTGNNAASGIVTISGGGTANTATAATIQVQFSGAQNVFISPFTRLELYVQVSSPDPAAPPTFRFIGTVPAGLVQDNPASAPGARLITSLFTLTPTTTPFITAPANGQNAYSVIVVGVNNNGDALVSNAVTVNVLP
jgi:hypothetical protein